MRLLGYQAYDMRNAGAVIHSHGMESCLVTMINPMSKEFRITHMEMIKGIQGHGYYDELVVPIIENTTDENELTDSLAKVKPIQKQQMCLFEIMAYTFGVTHGSVLKLSNSHFGGSLSDYSNCHDPQRRSL